MFAPGTALKLAAGSAAAKHSVNPLVLLSGWMGASAKQLRPYQHFYNQHGMDTLTFAASAQEVLNPVKGRVLFENCMTEAMNIVKDTSDIEEPRPIIFHGFSVSGFLFGNGLLAMQESPQEFALFRKALSAQIFDSPPDYEGIAGGLGRSLETHAIIERTVEAGVALFLAATKNTIGVHHRASSDAFHANMLTEVPALALYGRDDRVSDFDRCQVVFGKWKASGMDVHETTFDGTPHIQHMRFQKDKYVLALETFLRSNNLLPQLK